MTDGQKKKRDRFEARFAMQRAINANPEHPGLGWAMFNIGLHEVRRTLRGIDQPAKWHAEARDRHYACLRRYILAHRRYAQTRLP